MICTDVPAEGDTAGDGDQRGNLSSLAAAWDRYTTEHRDEQFTWAAMAPATGESPGVEVLELRPGYRVLDLGCGAADNAAHLAALGVQVTGIDLSPVQVATARQRWGHVANLTVEHGEAVEYLSATSDTFDAVYSVFGAVWFTDPAALLPVVQARLRPGGVFAFSQADVQPAAGRCNLDNPAAIERWDFRPATWSFLLRTYGFRQVTTRELPATKGFRGWPTMLVTGQTSLSSPDTTTG